MYPPLQNGGMAKAGDRVSALAFPIVADLCAKIKEQCLAGKGDDGKFGCSGLSERVILSGAACGGVEESPFSTRDPTTDLASEFRASPSAQDDSHKWAKIHR